MLQQFIDKLIYIYNFQFNYEYNLQHLLYKREGDMYGRFYNLEINTVVTIDLANYYLYLNILKFSEVS